MRRHPTIVDVRDYWDARPCNVRHGGDIDVDTDPLAYSRAVTARKYRVEPHIVDFSEFDRWQGKRVLDAGCGIGTMALSFAEAGAQVVAVDLSPKSIEIARKRAVVTHTMGSIRFMTLPLEELTRYFPPEEPFDLVYSFGVLHHTPYPQAALYNLREYMGPDSTMKLMLYHKVSWKVLWILLRGWNLLRLVLPLATLDRIVARHSEAQTGCPITRTYTQRQARLYLEDHGLRVTRMRVDHIFPYQIPAYIRGEYVKEWYWQRIPPPVFRWLERHFGWHLLIDAVADPSLKRVGLMKPMPLRIG